MPVKINYDTFEKMLRDVDVPDEEIAWYVNAVPSKAGAFNIMIEPNPDRVFMTEDEKEYEDAMAFANGIARWRRRIRFKKRMKQPAYGDWPVLVSEGDSWFQFPLLIEDVIDHLSVNYLINSLGAAGDTAENMAAGPLQYGGQEYFTALKKQAKTGRLDGFLFSAAGNDVIGEDPKNPGKRMLAVHLKKDGNEADPLTYIKKDQLKQTMNQLKKHYETVINRIQKDGELNNIPIFIHGYDYCYPGGHADDPRKRQLYARRDQWLGRAFKEKNILPGQRDKQREIIKYMIDQLYKMMDVLTGQHKNLHLIDVRGTLDKIEDWNDEIHGTGDGFKRVAMKFDNAIQGVI